jgi:hypothetical protein
MDFLLSASLICANDLGLQDFCCVDDKGNCRTCEVDDICARENDRGEEYQIPCPTGLCFAKDKYGESIEIPCS